MLWGLWSVVGCLWSFFVTHEDRHRGPHPRDRVLFGPEQLIRLRRAVGELDWLLSRGYAGRSALKLVGDRHDLTQRQRMAVARSACADASLAARRAKAVQPRDLASAGLAVDGFNLLITIETALSGGLVLLGRDGCARDLASVHGSYRSVQETERALSLIGGVLTGLAPASVTWFLDRPVSNSGRLGSWITALATERGWPWSVRIVYAPDVALAQYDGIVATSDSSVLDRIERWVNLSADLVRHAIPGVWLVDLGEQ